MNSITKLFDKYKTFEENLKQERFWLFIPVYLLKTSIIYIIILVLSVYINIFIYNFSLFIDNIYRFNNFIDNIIHFPLICIMFLSPGLAYFLIFSRNQKSIHPFIITFLYYYIADSQDEGLYLGILFGVISGLTVITIQYIIILFRYIYNNRLFKLPY